MVVFMVYSPISHFHRDFRFIYYDGWIKCLIHSGDHSWSRQIAKHHDSVDSFFYCTEYIFIILPFSPRCKYCLHNSSAHHYHKLIGNSNGICMDQEKREAQAKYKTVSFREVKVNNGLKTNNHGRFKKY